MKIDERLEREINYTNLKESMKDIAKNINYEAMRTTNSIYENLVEDVTMEFMLENFLYEKYAKPELELHPRLNISNNSYIKENFVNKSIEVDDKVISILTYKENNNIVIMDNKLVFMENFSHIKSDLNNKMLNSTNQILKEELSVLNEYCMVDLNESNTESLENRVLTVVQENKADIKNDIVMKEVIDYLKESYQVIESVLPECDIAYNLLEVSGHLTPIITVIDPVDDVTSVITGAYKENYNGTKFNKCILEVFSVDKEETDRVISMLN